MKKCGILLLIALCLFPLFVAAEHIEKTLMPDLSGAPWCEGILFDISMEEPQPFPSPIPCFQTKCADLNVSALQKLLKTYGIPNPDGESWYNGWDDINQRFAFCEMNHARHHLYTYPSGNRSMLSGHQQEENLRTAISICQRFLADAGITGIEEPYYIVSRNHERDPLNSLGISDQDEGGSYIDNALKIHDDSLSGIGFRYTLGGLPVAPLILDDPTLAVYSGVSFDPWGSMTIRDDGLITQLELSNYRTISKELEPYDGPVCSWEDAVSAMLDSMIHRTYIMGESYLLDEHERLRITAVEPSLALTPDGTTFPVWSVTYQEQFRSKENGKVYYNSATGYVDARTGEVANTHESS